MTLLVRSLAVLCLGILGCDSAASDDGDGGGGEAAGGAAAGGATGGDGGGSAEGGAAAGGAGQGGSDVLPIEAPENEWTFVPIEGAVCASGTQTGIGVRLRSDSRELLLYLQGGGACTTGQTCWVSTQNAANVNGYGSAEFAEESLINSYALFADD